MNPIFTQGNIEKVVVVIKDKDEVALERFIFSIQTMIAIESFNKDTRSTSTALPVPHVFLVKKWPIMQRRRCHAHRGFRPILPLLHGEARHGRVSDGRVAS
jgi:hypothetical protein